MILHTKYAKRRLSGFNALRPGAKYGKAGAGYLFPYDPIVFDILERKVGRAGLYPIVASGKQLLTMIGNLV